MNDKYYKAYVRNIFSIQIRGSFENPIFTITKNYKKPLSNIFDGNACLLGNILADSKFLCEQDHEFLIECFRVYLVRKGKLPRLYSFGEE